MPTKYKRQQKRKIRKSRKVRKGGHMDDLPQETKDALDEKFVQGYKPRMDEIDSVLRDYRLKGITLSYRAYKDLMDYVLHITGATKFEPRPKTEFELALEEERKKGYTLPPSTAPMAKDLYLDQERTTFGRIVSSPATRESLEQGIPGRY